MREHSDTSSLEELDVELAVGDLTSGGSLARAVNGCGFVFHCGALVSDWATTQEITRTNVAGTRNLLEAAAGTSVRRFVHFSTTDVYGHPGTGAVDESYASRGFSNWYAQTKLAAEGEVRRVEAGSDLDAVILRPATIYGPGSCDVVGGIARAIRDRSMLLIDGGRSDAGLCFVENLLDAALLALEHDAAPGQAFNVSDDLGVTWREFTDGLAEGLGCSRVRWSVPYWAANGVGTSLEHGYRLLRRTTGLTVKPPLLPARPSRCSAGTRPSAAAKPASCSAGSPGWTTPRASTPPSPGCGATTWPDPPGGPDPPGAPGRAQPAPTCDRSRVLAISWNLTSGGATMVPRIACMNSAMWEVPKCCWSASSSFHSSTNTKLLGCSVSSNTR